MFEAEADSARSFLDDVDIHLFSGFDGGRFGQEPNRVYRGPPFSDNASDILMSDAMQGDKRTRINTECTEAPAPYLSRGAERN